MLSLGNSGGIGGPSSSSSNLSASAPPFTIDRFSSNPNYTDSSYLGPFGHTWQYPPTPSAPQSEVEESHSTRKTSMPLSGDYGYLGAGSVSGSSNQWPAINPGDGSSESGFYVSETRGYQAPFISSVVPEDGSSLNLSRPMYDQSSIHVSSQADYTGSLSMGYMPRWQGAWKGEGSHGNQIGSGGSSATKKLNESSPFVYKNYITEGPTTQSGDASKGDPGILYGLSTDGIQMASHAGSYDAGITDGNPLFAKRLDAGIYTNPVHATEKDKYSKSFNIMNIDGRSKSLNMMDVDGESLFSQNLDHLPFGSSGTQFQGSNSSFPEFSPPGTFQESSKCFINKHGSQELCIQPFGSLVKDPTLPMKPACTVVIKPPANCTSSSARDTDKFVGNRIASNCGRKLLDIPHLSEENALFMSTRAESTEGSCYANKTDKDGNYWNLFSSNSKLEVPINSQMGDTIDFMLSNRPASQITDPNVSYGLSPSSDSVQAYKYTEDSLENNIPALDSPCWKGAQTSNSSNNNTIESLPGIQFLKELDGCLDMPANPLGPLRVASQDLSTSNANLRTGCAPNDGLPSPQDLSIGNANLQTGCAANDELPSQTGTSGSTCAAIELNPNAAAKEVINCSNPRSSMDGQFLYASDKSREEHNLSNILMGNEAKYSCSNHYKMGNRFVPVEVNLHSCVQDGVTHCDEAADAGAVAYHAAENVLYSPPTQEVCEEHRQPSVEAATQRVDISSLVNAMHSLSEVLRSNCSANSSGLTKENQVSLKSVIRNLDACVSKKIVDSTPVSDFMVPQQSTSISTGDGCDLGEAKGADQPHKKYQAKVISDELGRQNIRNEKINYSDSGNQPRCLPYFLPSEHNKRISNDEMMVQAIKKVLDENFTFEEEMQSQVLLFKNLWLEAEARLCSISYRARFDQMRVQMDEYKLNNAKGIAGYADKIPGSKDSPRVEDASLTAFLKENGASLEGVITKQSSSSIDTIPDNVNTSLLPRVDALSQHSDGFSSDEQPRKTEGKFGSIIASDAVGQAQDFGSEVFARLNILKQRDAKLNEVQQPPCVLNTNNSGRRSTSSSNSEIQADHAEAAIVARLNILKQRDDKPNEVQQQLNGYDVDNSGRLSGSSISTSNSEIQVNDEEAAFLARINVLKQRVDKLNEVQRLYDADISESQVNLPEAAAAAAALARLNILKQRDSRSAAEEFQNVDFKKAEGKLDSSTCGYGYESLKDYTHGAINDQVTEPGSNSKQGNSKGSNDSSSSEWEHVQKDDVSWLKG